MSFTDVVKEEICLGLSKKPCCHRALMAGILLMRGQAEGEQLSLFLDNVAVRELAAKLVFEQFGRECKLLRRKGTVASTMLRFSSANAADRLRKLSCADDEMPIEEKCVSCRRSFLSGIFLACGRVTDPAKQYLLEFSCGEHRGFLKTFLETLSLAPKESDRRAEKLLYFRDSTSIEDLFTHMGITQATFALMDKKIERGMRNDANRLANCDANNIEKAIAVSMRQTELIRRLIEENKISFLPPKLEKTARLRLQHEGLSVGQLAEMENPPLTKSGLHHRLEKITELAEGLLEDKGGGV